MIVTLQPLRTMMAVVRFPAFAQVSQSRALEPASLTFLPAVFQGGCRSARRRGCRSCRGALKRQLPDSRPAAAAGASRAFSASGPDLQSDVCTVLRVKHTVTRDSLATIVVMAGRRRRS